MRRWWGLVLPDAIGTDSLPWWLFRVFVDQLPEGRESAFRRAVDPKGDGLWSLEAHLGALAVDALRVLAWQQTEDGTKGRRPPKPIERPGMAEAREQKSKRIKFSAEEWQRRRAARRAAMAARQAPAANLPVEAPNLGAADRTTSGAEAAD